MIGKQCAAGPEHPGLPFAWRSTTPGSIHEGGESGYSLNHAFGAAFGGHPSFEESNRVRGHCGIYGEGVKCDAHKPWRNMPTYWFSRPSRISNLAWTAGF